MFSMILKSSVPVQHYELLTHFPSSHATSGSVTGDGFSTLNLRAYQNSPTTSDRNMTLKTDTKA